MYTRRCERVILSAGERARYRNDTHFFSQKLIADPCRPCGSWGQCDFRVRPASSPVTLPNFWVGVYVSFRVNLRSVLLPAMRPTTSLVGRALNLVVHVVSVGFSFAVFQIPISRPYHAGTQPKVVCVIGQLSIINDCDQEDDEVSKVCRN